MPGTESIETRAATWICRSMREKRTRSKRRFLDADARKASQKLYLQERYEGIVAEYQEFAQRLSVHGIESISVSALLGDNVVERSDRMSWYNRRTWETLKRIITEGQLVEVIESPYQSFGNGRQRYHPPLSGGSRGRFCHSQRLSPDLTDSDLLRRYPDVKKAVVAR